MNNKAEKLMLQPGDIKPLQRQNFYSTEKDSLFRWFDWKLISVLSITYLEHSELLPLAKGTLAGKF